MELSCGGKLIILTVGCGKYLTALDKRLFQSGRISIMDGDTEELPALVFIAKQLAEPEHAISGIDQLPEIAAREEGIESIN
ncbi:MAG: hypothetical protein LIP01_05450, partial [Tannerellaceae bacterium]|nr:hypothetical protein [Tannerellaceae bacterium]